MKSVAIVGFCSVVLLSGPVFAEGDAARGKSMFSRCSACHAIDGKNRVGPHLDGVVGRTAGKVEGARYSNAMAQATIVWDGQTLDQFLSDPKKLVPGTAMSLRVGADQDRQDIIAYLQSLSAH